MVDKYSTRAPSKDTEERMVFHMSCDTTQHRAFETTFCVGWLMKRQQTNHGRESRCLANDNRLICYSFQLGLICGAAHPKRYPTRPRLSLFFPIAC